MFSSISFLMDLHAEGSSVGSRKLLVVPPSTCEMSRSRDVGVPASTSCGDVLQSSTSRALPKLPCTCDGAIRVRTEWPEVKNAGSGCYLSVVFILQKREMSKCLHLK